MVQAGRRQAFAALEAALKKQHQSPHLLIVDDNMHLRSMRAECFKLARDRESSLQCCLARSAERAVHLIVAMCAELLQHVLNRCNMC